MDRILFLKRFIDEPKKIGSLTPSSRFLVSKMLDDLPWKNFSHVAELGAGTGTFTAQIVKRKSPACKLLVVEQDFAMRQLLEEKYPQASFESYAENLCAAVRRENFVPLDAWFRVCLLRTWAKVYADK